MNTFQKMQALEESLDDLAEFTEKLHFLSNGIVEHIFDKKRAREAEVEIRQNIEGYLARLHAAVKAAEYLK